MQKDLGLQMIQQETTHHPKGWEIDQLTGPSKVKSVLAKFSMVFNEPRTLPPHRKHDHTIRLEEGVKGLNLRPHWYSVMQKDVIEGLVDKMLQMRIV